MNTVIRICVTQKSEKVMAPHSSTLAWKIPWMEELGGLQSMGSRRVGYDWATSLSLFTFTHWRRKWQPTPVFLPGESQGRQSLVGCYLWGHKQLDMTEATWHPGKHGVYCLLMLFPWDYIAYTNATAYTWALWVSHLPKKKKIKKNISCPWSINRKATYPI